MTRSEIIAKFRQENPEGSTNVVSDSVLNSWLETGNIEIATSARLVRSSTGISTVVDQSTYNLTNEITKFYDIDEFPGGGVVYDNKRIDLVSLSGLDEEQPNWRNQSSGRVRKYYRDNQFLILYPAPDEVKTLIVHTVLIADSFDDDNKLPFNELSYLEPFHYILVLYLKKKLFEGKIKKPESTMAANQEYLGYLSWMKNEINRGIYKNIQFRPKTSYRGTSRNRHYRSGTR